MVLKKEPTAPAPVTGVPVVLGGHEYTVPALTLFGVRQFAPRLKVLNINAPLDPDSLDLLAEIAHAALKRNYPELTLDSVLELLDLASVKSVFEAVMGVSGFEPAKEGAGSGESTGRS